MSKDADPERRLHPPSTPRGTRAAIAIAALLLAGDAAAQPGPPTGPAPTLAEQAREAYERRDFVAAARMYEVLFADTGAVKYLFNAGMAREAAGNDALAIRHWERYLREATEIAPEERAQLTEQRAAARRRTMPVRLVADGTGPVTVELRYTTGGLSDPLNVEFTESAEIDLDPGVWTLRIAGSQHSVMSFTVALAAERTPREIHVAGPEVVAAPPTRPEAAPGPPAAPRPDALVPMTLRFSPARAARRGVAVALLGPSPQGTRVVRAETARVHLKPGRWVVTARARGYLPREVAVGPELPPDLVVRLEPDRRRRAQIGTAIGLGVAGLAAIGVGSAVTVWSSRSYRETMAGVAEGAALTDTQALAAAAASDWQARGTGFIAAGVAAEAVAASVASGAGKKLLIAEAGVGAGLAVIGAIGAPIAVRSYQDFDERLTRADFTALRTPDLIMNTTLGLGAGLLVGAVLAIVTRGSVRPRARPDRASIGAWRGLSVTGRF